MMLETLLSRLRGVKKTRNGWIACCPSHDDKTPSLSIAAGNDGRILLHCFSGCTPVEVLGSVGLGLSDLFPARLSGISADARWKTRLRARETNWCAALGVLSRESTIVYLVGCAVHAGQLPSNDEMQRLAKAVRRIHAAREVLT